ncbi:MAG: PIN domain-containing protein [Chloroflexi bacterium]|nr:PIN domain-containing protein [Chloroflexota bacterium]
MAIFADTSALFALLNQNDRRHLEAAEAARQIAKDREPVWTIDAVAVELWRLLRGQVGCRQADELLRGLISHGLEIEASARDDYTRAWQLADEWSDQDFALTDRLCFAGIERARSYHAWSYDSDFAVIRLGPSRNRPLALLF